MALDGLHDIYLKKFDSEGLEIWTKEISSDKDDISIDMTISDDGFIYLTGLTEGDLHGELNSGGQYEWDYFITKFDLDGNKIWTKLCGASGSVESNSITSDDNGFIYVTGTANGNLDGKVGLGGQDAFVSKFNSEGEKVWTNLIGSIENDYSTSIDINSNGSIYITGGTLFGESDWDSFLAKLDENGDLIWKTLITTRGSGNNNTSSILVTDDESIIVSGSTNGNLNGEGNSGRQDAFFSKYNSLGIEQWTTLLGTSEYETGGTIALDNEGHLYFIGNTSGDLNGEVNNEPNTPQWDEPDVFVTKADIESTWIEVGKESTYQIASSEEGKSIKSVISYQDAQGFNETVTTSTSSIPFVDDGVATFSINGTAAVGNTLQINQDSADPDGNGTLSYSWQISSDIGTWRKWEHLLLMQ